MGPHDGRHGHLCSHESSPGRWERPGSKEVDIKRYCKTEKIPGGELSDCRVLDGVMFNKDVTHPKMRRRIENPKIYYSIALSSTKSQTNVEITNEEDWDVLLRMEEEYIENICNLIIASG